MHQRNILISSEECFLLSFNNLFIVQKVTRQTFVNLFRVWFWFRFGALLVIAWKLDHALVNALKKL